MGAIVEDVVGRQQLASFIKLPFKIHKGREWWVPPLLSDEWAYFDSRKNPYFKKCDVVLALAVQDGVPVGRIMGIINRQHNERMNQRHARFGYLECYEDLSVARPLLEHVENWARRLGMEKLVGPMGFSDQDPEGYLVEGFEYAPTIATYCNFPYLTRLLEDCGYVKEIDYVVYLIDLTRPLPAFYDKIYERVLKHSRLEIMEFKRRSELKPFIEPVFKVMNDTYMELYGFEPLGDDEIKALTKRFLPVMDPRFIKAARLDGRLIGFLIAMPNIDNGFRKAKGHLFPFGFIHLLRALKQHQQLDLLLAGIRSEYRGRGFDAAGMVALMRSAREAGFKMMDSHIELENNARVRAEMERLGGQVCKRYRIYQKPL